jgi:hypothetical protein
MAATEYKCPPARLARVFRRSRDVWKQRAADKQRALKKMRITVRDLTDSRDRWKALARQQAQQLADWRGQVDPTEQESAAGGR